VGENGSLKKNITTGQPLLGSGLEGFNKGLASLERFVREHTGLVVWGAGAKGSTFVNMIDENASYISAVVDINPKKVGGYIGRTGHKIISPTMLDDMCNLDILVMNENYLDEVKSSLMGKPYNFFTLGREGVKKQ